MAQLVVLPELFYQNHTHPPNDLTMESNQPIQIEEAVLHFSTGSFAKALDYFYAEDKIYNEDGSLTIKVVNVSDLDWLVASILSFGEDVEVREPLMLRQQIQNKIAKMSQRYEEV
nr:WYL domain-containing protein [Paenibacillus sp. SYP-B3998]